MLKVTKIFLTAFMVFVVGVSFSLADDRDRKRDKKRDGSCQGYLTEQEDMMVIAADRDRKRNRKRDGSCNS